MADRSQEIIFHQYDISPFSEKVRVVFGLKDLAWNACIQPVIMPKPELIPLTGGYRKIPVMQIGADVYCDTQVILDELETRFPTPSMYAGADKGLSNAIAFWQDRPVFTLVCAVLGAGQPVVKRTDAFTKDREALFEREFDPVEQHAAIPNAFDQLRAHFSYVDTQLADGRKFLLGDAPGHADASCFYNLAFLRWVNPALMDKLGAVKHLRAWEERVKAIGHGRRSEITPAEALDIARDATSTAAEHLDPEEPNGFKPGEAVTVNAEDYGRDKVAGTLVASSATRVAIRRNDPRVGDVVLHFPRAGFVVQRA
ncbi:glutathione S-transferase family protein [uncultured Phenylobacterium sp.]|uniref:glutathione S-transferase family protein n=1 Tax=uncultured Phenylobacterium sp. TaxID=349273 RepID=UPI0025FD2B68|nr:glutathione S-transferase family protein [uncultured Phenylobacterium sp.]